VVRMRKLYEDEELEVYRTFDNVELEKAIIEAIESAGRPLSWRELRAQFSGVAGEDRLRKVLVKLIEEDKIIEMPDGAFGLPQMIDSYVPNPRVKRVRPLVPAKFYARWGTHAIVLRRAGKPLGELLKTLNMSRTEAMEETEEQEMEQELEEVL